MMIDTITSPAKNALTFTHISSLPGDGWGGMYAGESQKMLFCFGGVNFPDKLPWEDGKKKWYDEIYMLQKEENWVKLAEKLPFPLAYGVSVSYQDRIIVIGGNNESGYSDKVLSYSWNGHGLDSINLPDLPLPIANMAGTLVNNVIIIAGGNNSLTGKATKKCYLLDLENISEGWSQLPSWPGSECLVPMCASHNGKFYLFGGETVRPNTLNKYHRHILDDAYSLIPYKSNGIWTGIWRSLTPMPKGISAAGSPLPVLESGKIVFWGGVDPLTALYADPAAHPGISQDLLLYTIDTDSWDYVGKEEAIPARVTLPVVCWNNRWVYISGEIKPGIRTNTIYQINEQ